MPALVDVGLNPFPDGGRATVLEASVFVKTANGFFCLRLEVNTQYTSKRLLGMSSSDREVLLALYRATGGSRWSRNNGWDTLADISSWYGVQVRDGQVVGLNLSKNNLQGPIPKELGQLVSLKELDLHWNRLEGPIPKELGQLTYLEELDLQWNELDGPIPKELAALSNLKKLNLREDQLTGVIPPELTNIRTLEEIDCRGNNKLSGILRCNGKEDVLRARQILHGETMDDGVVHSWVWRAAGTLTSLWHFLLPVLDAITDLWLLVETSGGSYRGLWWTCMCVLFVAEIERVYTAFFSVALAIRIAFCCATCCFMEEDHHSRIISFFAGQDVNLNESWWLLLDSLLWTLFGSRARSSQFMAKYGLAGQAAGNDLKRSGLGLHGIDVMLFYHPMRYLGEFIMIFPRGHRRGEVTDANRAERRHVAMVRAVGETLCVDSLFLTLSVATGDSHVNFTGLAMVSALFSMLELVTELQHYVTQAEATKAGVAGYDEVGNEGNASAGETAVVNDIEVGDGESDNQASQPIESVFPVPSP